MLPVLCGFICVLAGGPRERASPSSSAGQGGLVQCANVVVHWCTCVRACALVYSCEGMCACTLGLVALASAPSQHMVEPTVVAG